MKLKFHRGAILSVWWRVSDERGRETLCVDVRDAQRERASIDITECVLTRLDCTLTKDRKTRGKRRAKTLSDAASAASATTQKTYKKIVISGNVLEVYEMENEPYQNTEWYQQKTENTPEWIEEWAEELKNRTEEEILEDMSVGQKILYYEEQNRRAGRNITRTRNMVRRLVLANFDAGSKFVTFTFAENVKDIDQANREWKKFVQRLRRRYGDFKYLSVIEFQKRGAVHYHMISDLPYVKKKELQEIWGQGFVKINRISHVDNVGAYIVKYMTKDLHDERLCGKKAYQCSKGLDRPITVRGEMAEELYEMYCLEQKKEVFRNFYLSEHHGLISYKEYNLKR